MDGLRDSKAEHRTPTIVYEWGTPTVGLVYFCRNGSASPAGPR